MLLPDLLKVTGLFHRYVHDVFEWLEWDIEYLKLPLPRL